MSHFNRKTATFYGIAIGSVLILFNIITTYGEANLKSPSSVAGSYKVQIEPQANCPNPEKLLLVLQQSGIYVGATLLSDTPSITTSSEYIKSFPLSGKLQEQQLKLTGKINNLEICRSSPVTNSSSTVEIQGKFIDDSLQGQITFGTQMESLKFTAKLQATDSKSQ